MKVSHVCIKLTLENWMLLVYGDLPLEIYFPAYWAATKTFCKKELKKKEGSFVTSQKTAVHIWKVEWAKERTDSHCQLEELKSKEVRFFSSHWFITNTKHSQAPAAHHGIFFGLEKLFPTKHHDLIGRSLTGGQCLKTKTATFSTGTSCTWCSGGETRHFNAHGELVNQKN